MPRVTHTHPDFTGSVGAVRFTDGEAETNLKRELAYMRKHPDTFTIHKDNDDQG